MQSLLQERQAAISSLITGFIQERLVGKLEKLKPDDPKRQELQAQYLPAVWLEDAARRVTQLQAVTHSLKPIHPDAKGTSLYAPPHTLAALPLVGSHCLGSQFETDVVGNAAALDVYKFLKLEHDGRTLLALSVAGDADCAAAMSPNEAQSQAWMTAFAGLTAAPTKSSSHTNAKQLYWLVGDDPTDDAAYHLLAPLYPTSLVHRVYATVQDDRFSDAAKAAREARRRGEYNARPVHEYGDLAVQKLGGTKPQNISQLNSERRGDNLLLASLPPLWRSLAVQPPLGVASMFKRFIRRREVLRLVKELRRFLGTDPARNRTTRHYRDELVSSLLDELAQFCAELHTLPAGWSLTDRCQLPAAEKRWLDPCAYQSENAGAGATDQEVAKAFAYWLNARLRAPLPIGDPEFDHWYDLALQQLKSSQWEAEYDD